MISLQYTAIVSKNQDGTDGFGNECAQAIETSDCLRLSAIFAASGAFMTLLREPGQLLCLTESFETHHFFLCACACVEFACTKLVAVYIGPTATFSTSKGM